MKTIIKQTLVVMTFFLVLGTVRVAVAANEWVHPGIDIKPNVIDANSNNVYSTHAGFVTYAGPAPAASKEKGWVVQIESDFNRDNVADVVTRYSHLKPDSLYVNDVRYRKVSFSPEFYLSKAGGTARSIPYGNGPYVTRNQLIGVVGHSGALTRTHVQYDIVTSRYISLYGVNLNTYSCDDDPYVQECSEDPSRQGLFFPVIRKNPAQVRGAAYVNPGIISPPPGPEPNVVVVHPAQPFELPEPPLPRPDFLPPPQPVVNPPLPTPPPLPVTPTPAANCTSQEGTSFGVNLVPLGNGVCGWYITIWPPGAIGDVNFSGTIGGVPIDYFRPGGLDCNATSAGSCPYGWIGSGIDVIDGVAVYEAQNCPPDYWEFCGFKFHSGQGLPLPQTVDCNGETNLVLTSNRGNINCSQ